MAVRRRPVNNNVETDNETTEQETAPKTSSAARARSRAVDSGWGSSGGGREEKREVVKAPFLDLREGRKLVKFLDAAPPVRFARHWVGGKFNNCPESLGTAEECPLCEKDNRPGQAFLMNVLDLTKGPKNDGSWEVMTYTFGVEVRNQLVSFLEDENKFPSLDDEKWYWEIRQVTDTTANRKTTKILPVKARDLAEDYDIEPLTEEELEDTTTRYGVESIFSPYVSKLEELARNL